MTTDDALSYSGLTDIDLLYELDDVVHTIKSEEATAINNNGMQAQLTFLEATIGKDELIRILCKLGFE